MNKEIINFYFKFRKLDNYIPNKKTNKLFHDFYSFCTKNDFDINEKNKIIKYLNNVCSLGEYEMEKRVVSKILDGELKDIKDFLYYKNYEKLSLLEYINAEFILERKIKNMLFIGGGPLPLTAIILAKEKNIKITILDNNIEAIALSKKLIKKLGLEKNINIMYGDALTYTNNTQYDICFVASLVFSIDKHEEILKNIYGLNFSLFLTRTAEQTRKVLYKKINEEIIKKYFKVEFICHPKNEIVNSIIIATKK